MNTRILIAAIVTFSGGHLAVAQMGGGGGGYGGMPQSQSPRPSGSSMQQNGSATTTTTTATKSSGGVKGFLDSQIAGSSDKKFHVSVKGKDLALTPVKFHQAKSLAGGKSSTVVDMKGADGKMYPVEFETSKGQVTGTFVLASKGTTP
jgi:hypothetical protein